MASLKGLVVWIASKSPRFCVMTVAPVARRARADEQFQNDHSAQIADSVPLEQHGFVAPFVQPVDVQVGVGDSLQRKTFWRVIVPPNLRRWALNLSLVATTSRAFSIVSRSVRVPKALRARSSFRWSRTTCLWRTLDMMCLHRECT